ncbi:MAG: iron ABC transporter permease [Acidimicrobiia bacterium]|nr:iron ABC transporter permease [Acidimicrobiia bacterium]
MTDAVITVARPRIQWGRAAVALAVAVFLLVFLVIPVVRVIFVAFLDPRTGEFTLINFVDFFNTSLFLESFWNSIYVAAMAVVCSTLIALPLAYFTTRFNFKGAVLIQSLGFIPLIMTPFVGAVAMQMIFGPNGTLNLLLGDWFGINVPFMRGLNAVIFVQSIHYFPFILINLSASLVTIDRTMEESAQNLGVHGFRLFRRVVFPLAMPGYVAGASIVFLKVFDDLGTPLLLNVNNMLAPQGYLRITTIGINDPMGYVISVLLVVFSLASVWGALLTLRGKDYATTQKGGGGLSRRDLRPWEPIGCYAVVGLILLVVLSPHIGLLLLSFGTIWSFAPLPDAYTLAHYEEVFKTSPQFVTNTLLYSSVAALIDVVLGTAIAYIVMRTDLVGRRWLDYVAMSAIAIPGLVLGIGYLRTFYDYQLPWSGQSLASWWVILAIALSVRRLPYALRACSAGLHQVSEALEESAENLGATKWRTVKRIVVPLMMGAMLAGFVTSFATAAVELSTTIMLVTSETDAPLAYGIYVFMQTPAGRGAGAALGVIAVAIVGLATYLSHRVVEESSRSYSMAAP